MYLSLQNESKSLKIIPASGRWIVSNLCLFDEKLSPRKSFFQRPKWILASIRSRFVSARMHPDITTKCLIEWLVWKGSRMPWGQCWHFFSPRSGCAVWSQPTWLWEPFYSVIWRQTHPWTEPKLPWKSEQGEKIFFLWLHLAEYQNRFEAKITKGNLSSRRRSRLLTWRNICLNW